MVHVNSIKKTNNSLLYEFKPPKISNQLPKIISERLSRNSSQRKYSMHLGKTTKMS